MIVTIYYLIPGLRDLFSFPIFLAGSGILLVGGGWVLGKILVKRFKIQPIENYISSEVNPFTNAALTAKERVYWNAMVVLLKKEHARPPDAEVAECVEQMNMYIKARYRSTLTNWTILSWEKNRNRRDRLRRTLLNGPLPETSRKAATRQYENLPSRHLDLLIR